ncbi:MAG: Phenylacetate-coenzyme A ligase PaaK, adenylate-forming domain family [Verrucomicrobia bacterium]|nr:MAG: Phenylacetate-coenzyme A ligase PaaK, adenylate-forming domain family [Verrucomicrobiota bacterium]
MLGFGRKNPGAAAVGGAVSVPASAQPQPPKNAVSTANPPLTPAAANEQLDAHLREIIEWHFSPETGCPFWLDWKAKAGWDPRQEIKTHHDLVKFDHFQDEWLRDEKNERFVPKGMGGRPFNVFETGGTTGLPKQRVGWDDYKHDYEQFGDNLSDEFFPRGSNWIMVGPTGPRRLRLAVEHLANYRGGSCYHVDLDPRWVKRLISRKQYDEVERYQAHVISQAVEIIKHRDIACIFTTPKLLASLGERISVPSQGLKGCFCGGTSMTPEYVRFLQVEVLENKAQFVPTYGNTLMGLAMSVPEELAQNNYSVTYWAPQPRAILRIVDPDKTEKTMDYGQYGRVELTTLTKEFFMPRFLERDEAIRRPPHAKFPWDGVGDVRPFGFLENKIIEGVY